MANLYYATDTNRTLTPGSLPTLSEGLESFRAYQWEVEIDLPSELESKPLTLAAKSVSQIAFTSEDIVVERVNDKYFYPGKVTPEAVTITFDNLVDGELAETLYDWMSNTYDSVHGVFTPRMISGVGNFKSSIRIYQLNNLMFPVKHIHLYGAYAKAWKLAEFNYATNEFHSVEVEVRFDFAVQYSGLD
jgi:hypothetical protein|tara:strand:- start:3273 stop:3839 length:567 start_codon:yes stop_codon:yes gene_type:complete